MNSKPSGSGRRLSIGSLCLASLCLAALTVVAPPVSAKVVEVIEFYHAGKDHYFITSAKDEIAKLDSGATKGWSRTGLAFYANDKLVNGTNAVCRYYLPAEHGDSHFFSASPAECAQVRSRHPGFIKESSAAMHLALPHHVTGACNAGHQPVFRLWNNRKDSNHRYVTDAVLRAQMVAQGWIPEGYGPNVVALCTQKDSVEPSVVTAALPPPCKGTNSRVAVPGGPHGMYVWSPNAYMLSFLEKDVIGKDPTLCGASLVIFWSALQS